MILRKAIQLTVLDFSGLDWILRYGFQIPGSGFRIPCKWNYREQNSGLFLKPKLWFQSSGLWIPKAKVSPIPDDYRLRVVYLLL